MNKAWLIAATGLLLAPAAMAENTAQTAPTASHSAASTPGERTAGMTTASQEPMRQQVKNDLEKAGFTDVHVIPDSYLVRAKSKSGDPVMMLINPDSVTEVMAANGDAQTADNSDNAGSNEGTFRQLPATGEDMSSKVIGLDVYNNSHQDIGTIKDIAYAGHNIKAYIVGVGGFLGMGDRYVAVNPSALRVTYDSNAKTWHASLNATADQLKSAPQFKYGSQS